MGSVESDLEPRYVPRVDTAVFALVDKRLHVLLGEPDEADGGESPANLTGAVLHGPEQPEDVTQRLIVTALEGHAIREPRIEQVHAQIVPDRAEPTVSIGLLAVAAVRCDGPYGSWHWTDVDKAQDEAETWLEPHDRELLARSRAWLRKRAAEGMHAGHDLSLHTALLPHEFILRDVVLAHQALLGQRVDRNAVRRAATKSPHLIDTGRREPFGGREARIFRFDFPDETPGT